MDKKDEDSGFFQKTEFYFSDKYSNFEEIYRGSNSSSVIYVAVKGFKKFIIKGLKQDYQEDPFYISQLRKEFEIGYLLDSPLIAKYYSFEDIEGYGPCIVREFIDGKTLKAYIKDNVSKRNNLNRLILEICDALEYLHHRQIVHLDLKPSNIMVTTDGNHIKLIDFGFADSSTYCSLKIKGGTQEFASPEQKGDISSPVSMYSDIYSFGKLLELLPVKNKKGGKKLISRMVVTNPVKRPEIREIKEFFKKEDNYSKPHYILYFLVINIVIICTFIVILFYYKDFSGIKKDENIPEIIENLNKIPEEEKTIDTDGNFNNGGPEKKREIEKEEVLPKHGDEKSRGKDLKNERVITDDVQELKDAKEGRERRIVHPVEIISYQEAILLGRKYYEEYLNNGDDWKQKTRDEIKQWLRSQIGENTELENKCNEAVEFGLNQIEEEKQKGSN